MTQAMWLGGFTVVYIIAMIGLSWWAGKKFVENEGEFMLGGRQFNSFLSIVGLVSILVSGGWLPAIVLYCYLFGVGGTWFYLSWGVALLVTMLLWAGFWRSSGAYTPSEWFEYRYGRVGRFASAGKGVNVQCCSRLVFPTPRVARLPGKASKPLAYFGRAGLLLYRRYSVGHWWLRAR